MVRPLERMAATSWIRLLFLLTFSQTGVCEEVATADFSTSGTITPLQWGQRSAALSCTLSFPGTTVAPPSAYIYMRFDVRVLDFTHYIAYDPDSVTTGSSLKWQIVRSDYSFTNSIYFTFAFVYSEYLGDRKPTGECTLFTNYTEALIVANSTPDLPTNASSRLVDTSPFSIDYVQSSTPDWDVIVTQCVLNPPTYIGLHEAYTLVSFDAPVYNISSRFGTEFVSTDPSSQWFFGRQPSHGGYFDEGYEFSVPAGSTQHSSGQCQLYAVSNETLASTISSIGTAPLTTTMTLSTVTLGTTVAVTTGSPTTITATTTPTTTVAANTFQIIVNFTHSGQRLRMKEDPGMRGQTVTGLAEMWHIKDSNPLTCGRQCLADTDCLSVFFSAETKICHAHNVTYSKGDTGSNHTSYFSLV